jgi:heme-degrading monooxygenase HmoA
MEARFASIYGPRGDWAKLFQTGEGYLRTELNRSLTDPQIYVTLDFWRSQEDYDRFRTTNSSAYQEIDLRCQPLTEDEVEIGRFATVSGSRV